MAPISGPKEEAASSKATSKCSYDVFLSFRGDDTRKNFTDHLYTAFVNAGFRTFRDDDELERGKDIKPELEKAIQQSRSSVIVISKDYAYSRWCLDELVMILERKRTSDDHVVLPVFYDVDPSQVRKQTGSFAKDFPRHEKSQSLKYTVKAWREALTQVADLAGMVLQNQANGHESKFIKKVVRVIEDKLCRTPLSVAPHVIGIHSQVENINLWIQDGSTDVSILVIHGMRGIGKTTMAKVVYNINSKKFQRSSFLENIKEISEQSNGLVKMQKQLLSQVLNGRKMEIYSVSDGIIKIKDAISSKKVLLVLDDVDHIDQLDAIVRMPDQFYPGSKVIMTTTHGGLLKAQHQVIKVHEAETLGCNNSLELFSWHAFGQDHPIEGYMEHSKRVVDHCAGLPLALKILGSSLSGQSIAVWESALNKLEVTPNGEILKKVRISYDSLQDKHDQNLFLHISCFLVGMKKEVVSRILDSCDFFSDVGIQNLVDRSLVRIEGNRVKMHHMIRDLGRGIVRLEAEEPGERSRLWNYKDCFKVLTEKTGTRNIEGLSLNTERHTAYTRSRNSHKVVFETKAFSRMVKLRLLQLSHVQLEGGYGKFPAGLRWLRLHQYPLDSLPSDFPLGSLVVLEICYSSTLRQVWKATNKYYNFPSMKVLNLSHSRVLTETPNFSAVPNLEMLILKDCASLVDVHESIGSLVRLVYLDLEDCKNIRELPKSISGLSTLETLIISGCSNLNEFPKDMQKIESLKVFLADGVQIVKLWSRKVPDICWASNLPRNLINLSLENVNLFDDDFPGDFGNLPSLRTLDLSGNPISGLPDCIRDLTSLDQLYFHDCIRLKSLARLPRVRQILSVGWNHLLERVTFQSSILERPKALICFDCVNLVEFENWYKLEPIERVEVEMINLLGLSNLDSVKTKWLDHKPSFRLAAAYTSYKNIHVQGLYEYGIFNTFLPDYGVPCGFSHKARGSSTSLTLPLLPNIRIRGLNFFSLYGARQLNFNLSSKEELPYELVIIVSNESKGLKWVFCPTFVGMPPPSNKNVSVTWLSHWKFENQLIEGGDEVVLSVFTKMELEVRWCGIQIVYEQEEQKMSSQCNTTHIPSYLNGISDVDLSESKVLPGMYVLQGPPESVSWCSMSWLNELNRGFNRQNRKRRSGSQEIPHSSYRISVSASTTYTHANANAGGGLGVIIRSPLGEVMAAYSRKYHGPFSEDVMVLPAMLMGLRLALDQGFEAVVLESCAHQVVECVLADDEPYYASEGDSDLLDEIRYLLRSFSFGTCRYQYGSAAYKLADTAAYSRREEYNHMWMKEIPEWLTCHILGDDALRARSS